MPIELSDIKPKQIVHARALASMPVPQDVHVGRVARVDGEYLQIAADSSEDAHAHWVPLAWVEKVTSEGVYLHKNVEEFMWGRLDQKPAH